MRGRVVKTESNKADFLSLYYGAIVPLEAQLAGRNDPGAAYMRKVLRRSNFWELAIYGELPEKPQKKHIFPTHPEFCDMVSVQGRTRDEHEDAIRELRLRADQGESLFD